MIQAIASRLITWLLIPGEIRDAARTSLVETVATHYSWESVAQTVIAAAQGELDDLFWVNGRTGPPRGRKAWRGGRHQAPAGRLMITNSGPGCDQPTS